MRTTRSHDLVISGRFLSGNARTDCILYASKNQCCTKLSEVDYILIHDKKIWCVVLLPFNSRSNYSMYRSLCFKSFFLTAAWFSYYNLLKRVAHTWWCSQVCTSSPWSLNRLEVFGISSSWMRIWWYPLRKSNFKRFVAELHRAHCFGWWGFEGIIGTSSRTFYHKDSLFFLYRVQLILPRIQLVVYLQDNLRGYALKKRRHGRGTVKWRKELAVHHVQALVFGW